jgi:hypothetical protein
LRAASKIVFALSLKPSESSSPTRSAFTSSSMSTSSLISGRVSSSNTSPSS